MSASTTASDLCSVWQSLSIINQGFVALFCAGSIYALSLSVYVLFALRGLRKGVTGTESEKTARCVLRRRLWNLRQLHLSSLYLLGFCIMFQIPGVFRTITISYDLPPVTVYRTLPLLTESGLLREMDFGKDYKFYDPNYAEHPNHNHIICQDCDKIVEFDSDKIEKIENEITHRLGFSVKSHRLQITATCEDLKKLGACKKKSRC